MKQVRGALRQQKDHGTPPAVVYFATRAGGTTLDTGEGGGNPFASALIEAANETGLQLRNLAPRLRELTAAKSCGHQIVECFGEPSLPDWRFQEDLGREREKRTALVLVVSDYSGFSTGVSLIGAARDERRIAGMLAQHGFSVDQGIEPRRRELIRALLSFRRRSQGADIAVVYSTGHGIESDGIVYLLPGDYPESEGFGSTQLRRHAIGVPRMVKAASACGQNLVFFAGCRELFSHY
jgi:hypothetical protein